MATCVKCGKLNYEGVKICTACGTPLPELGNDDYSDSNDDFNEDENSQQLPNEQTDEKPESDNPETNNTNKRIVFIILGILIAVGAFFLIRYLLADSGDTKLNFTVSPIDSLRFADTELTFSDNTTNAKSWVWDFGDGTDEEMTQMVKHIYSAAGSYWIKLSVNNKLKDSLQIVILDNNKTEFALDTIIPDKTEARITMSLNSPVKVGQSVTFTDNTPGATSWEWRFNEDGKVNAKTKTATYQFKYPKRKRVISVNNNISLTGTYELEVIDLAEKAVIKEPKKEAIKEVKEPKEVKKAEKIEKPIAEAKNNPKDLKDLQVAFNTLASKSKATSDSKKEKDFLNKLFNESDPNRIDVYVKVTHKGKTNEQSIHDVISDIIFTKPNIKVKGGFKNNKNAFQNIEIEY